MIASFDALETLLALGLTVVALACLFDRHLVRACCFFVAFALAMTLAWWQLGAPWLAAVELLLGAVLTGLCFFYALGRFFPGVSSPLERDSFNEPWTRAFARLLLALAWFVMVGAAIRYVITDMVYSPDEQPLLLAGVMITASALGAFALHRHVLRRLLAFNILGSGVFMLLAGVAGTSATAQALITVGLCIAWLGSMLGALLIRQLLHLEGVDALRDGNPKENAT
ncbi:hydrogenase subunit MbhD domain-containing protein [Halovibrio sp. HP20-50]|uniref:hydrogenase subunit MbhD domain-containing protein n=1 Tax=Halovibrio sp. HP20-59 TaxID=3080275 RepID=UPI00294B4131|nr:hydrogenase subunit MbhD domain-containing protein [Halovibrio sp. HP20-59]MEA2117184.1 hydrogenase subunit MbhD domain-containing protein [Halovibrio sp. HP20-59]